jgi:hypothetical protein
MERASTQFFILLSAALFLFCLTQPAVDFERVCKGIDFAAVKVAGLWHEPIGEIETMKGFYLLLSGGFGLFFGQIGAVGWVANLLYFIAFGMSLKTIGVPARQLAIASLIIAIASLPITNLAPVLADEGGVCFLSAISPLFGHWLWLEAIAALNVAVWFSPLSATETHKVPHEKVG